MIAWQAELAEMRDVWDGRGEPGPAWFPPAPTWYSRDGAFDGSRSRRLWETGDVDWACVVDVHDVPWGKSVVVAKATVVFSDDPELQRHPDRLGVVAAAIRAVRAWPAPRPGLGWLRTWATRGPGSHTLVERLPLDVTQGRSAGTAAVLGHAAILPTLPWRVAFVPIVRAMDGSVDAVHLAPRDVWSRGLLERWREASAG